MPCADLGMDCFRDHLTELEKRICESHPLGPVFIAGDFNAHLCPLGGPKGLGQPNHQGLLLKDLIDRCSLHVISLSARSEGPSYTYWNSNTETTVDYILGNVDALNFTSHCFTHELNPLNTSDHLPQTAIVDLTAFNLLMKVLFFLKSIGTLLEIQTL